MAIKLQAEQVYHPSRGMNIDANGITARLDEAIDCVNINIESDRVTPRDGTKALELQGDGIGPVLKYHRYVHPTDGTILFAFCASDIYRYDSVYGWISVTASADVFSGIEQWSITNVIDKNYGSTVVVAGSSYTNPTSSYADAADRVLLIYDPDLVVDDLGVSVDVGFIDMVINKNTYDTETYATAIDSAAPPDTNDWTLSADRAIVSGTAYLVVDTIGVIATAGLAIHKQEFGTSPNITEVDVNFWLPVDEDEIAFGETSYIRLDTGAISVEFLKDTYDGDDLTIYYQFEEEVTYRPLYVSNYHNALVMANTVEYFITATGPEVGEWTYTPWRVRWSEQGNVSLYRENHYQDLALSDISPILGMKSLETSASSNIFGPLYFYKHNSIIRGTYNQSYNLNADFPVPMFNFEIAYSEGIEAFETLVSIEGMHFFLGRNDVYAFNGYERKSLTHDRETGSTRIQKYLFDKLNLDALYRCHGVYDEIKRFYYLFLTYNTASGIYPEDCFVYDIDGGTWIRHTYSGVSAAISLDATLGGAIDNLAGTIDGLGTTTIDSLTANKAKFLLFAIGGYTYYTAAFALDEADINDIAFDPYFISRDFLGTTLEEKDRVQKVILEAKDDTLQVGYSAHYDTAVADFEQLDTLTFSSAYRREPYHPDEVSTSFRLLVRLGANAVFRWLQVFSKKLEFEGE